MASVLPKYEAVYAQFGADCVRDFYVRSFPDPNQDGSPGTLKDLTGATFAGDLTDYTERRLTLNDGSTFNLGTYLAVASTGVVRLTIPSATVNQLPSGTFRYWTTMTLGGTTAPLRAGQFAVTGARYRSSAISPTTIVSPPAPAVSGTMRYAGSIPAPTARTYVVDPEVESASTITLVKALATTAGTLTATLTVNGVAVPGVQNVAVTTTVQNVDFATYTLQPEDEVAWVLTNVSGAAGFQFSIPVTLLG